MTVKKFRSINVSKVTKPKEQAGEAKPSVAKPDAEPVIFELIPPRLTMMTHPTEYVVCVDEVQRRTESPEFMNSSIMAGHLKRQKSVNDGNEMRQKLSQHGIEIDSSRRKGVPLSTISPLCESEMAEINRDLKEILDETYPAVAIAKRIFSKAKSYEEQKRIVNDAVNSIKFADLMMKAFNSSRPATAGHLEVLSGNQVLDEEMKRYSKLTHGFGPENFRIWNDQYVRIFKTLAQMKPDPTMFDKNLPSTSKLSS